MKIVVGYLKVEKLNGRAKLPEKAHDGDLGYDLFSSEVTVIQPGESKLVGTGIRVEFPPGWGGQFFDRSGNASKKNYMILAGTIDNGYRGELKVLVYNFGKFFTHINIGDKIAQIIPIQVTDFEVIEDTVVVEETARGENGFGSTGN